MKLKPCPFCGGEPEPASDEYREKFINDVFGTVIEPAARNFWIACTVCGARGKTVTDRDYDGFKDRERERRLIEQAAAAWNNRKGEES